MLDFCQFEPHQIAEQQLFMIFIYEVFFKHLVVVYLSNLMILIFGLLITV